MKENLCTLTWLVCCYVIHNHALPRSFFNIKNQKLDLNSNISGGKKKQTKHQQQNPATLFSVIQKSQCIVLDILPFFFLVIESSLWSCVCCNVFQETKYCEVLKQGHKYVGLAFFLITWSAKCTEQEHKNVLLRATKIKAYQIYVFFLQDIYSPSSHRIIGGKYHKRRRNVFKTWNISLLPRDM